MKNTASPCPDNRETIAGFSYLAFQLLFLSGLLIWVNRQLSVPLSDSELNFTYYLINFMVMLLIFHNFLGRSASQLWQHPIVVCQAVILALAGYYALRFCTEWLVGLIHPGFSNYNDAAISEMSRSSRFLMTVGTVILVPPVEECFFRGLIFRNLYKSSRLAAYAVSILAFSMIHILGYIGVYSPLELILAVAQYLPAGLCLAWAYVKGGTIFAPIAVHALINFIAIRGLR